MKLNLNLLREHCQAPVEAFMELGDVWETPRGRHIFIDNHSSVLGIAHLDSVVEEAQEFKQIRLNSKLTVFNQALDDRLGAYLLLDYLPLLGLEYDILLTEGEESGQSTGAYFQPPRQYNWMFQFDRAGTDVVTYQYRTKELDDLLKLYQFKTNWGSFSDISSMDDLGCKGINFGTGYYANHSYLSHMIVADTRLMVDKFVTFYSDLKDVQMPHVYVPSARLYQGYGLYAGYGVSKAVWMENDEKPKNGECRCTECNDLVEADEFWFSKGLCNECWREASYVEYASSRQRTQEELALQKQDELYTLLK